MMNQAVEKAQNESPSVKRRMEDMMAYMHTVVLYYNARKAQDLPETTPEEKDAKTANIRKQVEEMMHFVWRTRKRQIMQFWGFMTRMGAFGKDVHSLVWTNWIHNAKSGTIGWMKPYDDYSSREIENFFAEDLNKYSSDSETRNVFSQKLIPFFPDKEACANSSQGYFTSESRWHFYVTGAMELTISLGGNSPDADFFVNAVVTDAAGKIIFSKNVTQYDTPDRNLNIIKLKLQPGLYHLSIKDAQNRYYPIFSPPVKNVYEQSDTVSCFNQYFAPGYFYVPNGIKTLYVRNSLYFKLKAPGWDKPREYKKGLLEIPVGDDDGEIWEILHPVRVDFVLLNVPPYVANNKNNLLIPAELKNEIQNR